MGRAFDFIEVKGVAHLADPFAGWRLLLSMLRPDGFMRLGIYSKLAPEGDEGPTASGRAPRMGAPYRAGQPLIDAKSICSGLTPWRRVRKPVYSSSACITRRRTAMLCP